MKEFIEKLTSKLGTLQRYYYYGVKDLVRVGEVEKIIEKLAAEYLAEQPQEKDT